MKHWSRREGKRYVYEVGVLCNIVALVLLLIAFCSPYWIQSWPRVHSGFKSIGLWEACFAGLVRETDPDQKSYHGCWWILAPEFTNIRSWLFPWYFICTQVIVTLCFCFETVVVGVLIYNWIKTGATLKKTEGKPLARDNMAFIQSAAIATTVNASLMAVAMVMFATAFKVDRWWLPHPYLNYLSWSYGLALVSTFFSIFAAINLGIHVLIVRQELREPPKAYQVSLSGYQKGNLYSGKV